MLKKILAMALFAVSPASLSGQSLTPGDIAIIGMIDNGSPDSFTFVTLTDIDVGTAIYFTDNGWIGPPTNAFRNIGDPSFKGNEGIASWTTSTKINAGTVVRSNEASSQWSWVFDDPFIQLAFAGQLGDQVYAFQGTGFDVRTVTNHLYLLDNSIAFEDATNTNTGNVPPGLTAGETALARGRAGGYMSVREDVLTGPARTKDEWLAVFANVDNWAYGSSGTLPSGSISVTPIPEPGSYAMLLAGICLVGLAARRHSHLGDTRT